MTIDVSLDENGEQHIEYELNPGETIFIKSQEKLSIPDNILGRIAEKNSRMRQGLVVSGPHYQPGHKTYAFLRVTNISKNIITLSRGNKIAQIIFEQLTGKPDVPYSIQMKLSIKGLEIISRQSASLLSINYQAFTNAALLVLVIAVIALCISIL